MAIDQTDRRILACLSRNARAGAAEIGREIGLSRQAVQARIAALEAGGQITGYRVETGAGAGLSHAVIWLRLAGRPCDPALDWLAGLPEILRLQSLSGAWDALAQVVTPDPAALSALSDRIAGSDLIAAHQMQIVLREVRGPGRL